MVELLMFLQDNCEIELLRYAMDEGNVEHFYRVVLND